jgi:SAM-dependent methyltransferase
VLEIGCGIGTDTTNFARHWARVTSVDLSEKSLELAKQRIGVYGFQDRVEFYQANAEELSKVVPPQPYDLIYSFGVIHHTPHPERVLEQLRGYTRPETTLKVMVYYRYAWKVGWILLTEGKGQFWKLQELVARNSEAQTGCPILNLVWIPRYGALGGIINRTDIDRLRGMLVRKPSNAG